MNSQNEHKEELSQQPHNVSYAMYSILTMNRNPSVKPGKTVEIEVFLSGVGMPEKNKLHIQWSLPDVINKNNPGKVTLYVPHLSDPQPEDKQLPSGNWLVNRKTNETGVTINLPQITFREGPRDVSWPDWAFAMVGTEVTHEFYPPILVTLNIANTAEAGDYEVTFTFTYGKDADIRQDYKAVPFHVNSKIEQWQWLVNAFVILGVVAAVASLVLTALWYLTHW